jgi:signal transduction histidine kinase/DNA-binding response OmpR family regulator
MPLSPDRLAQDLQRALTELQKERARVQRLQDEVAHQHRELERLRHSVHRESNSRLLAVEALDETRDRLQLAVEAAGLALWDWQLPAPQVFLSARWGEMIGDIAMEGSWDVVDLVARVHPDDRARVKTDVNALLGGMQQRSVVQYRVRSADDWLWIESHGMVAEHDSAGRPLRLMGTHADITERKRSEQVTQQAREQAEQASKAKSEFLANISHEVRTPLNALMGLTRLLMDSPVNPEQKSWLDLMDSSAHALLDQLNDVLDLSRIEAGKLDIESVRFPLHTTLQDIGALYSEQARSKSLTLTLDIQPEVPPYLLGDPGRVRQVLGNLLSNALKFTPRGGRIGVTAALLPASASQPRRLQLQVRDSGVGIARQHQAHLFEAFTQADASTARRYGGSGLGLAICSRLVRLMGGTIELQSELGQGSSFRVTLPVSQDAPVSDLSPLSAPAELNELAQVGQRFAGLNVLVAEDHPVNELLMNQMLKRLGIRVHNARDGDQAVKAWAQGGMDLILMDVQMPGTTGLQATQRIREQESRQGMRRTPIVAVTANAMVGDREACLAAGVDAYTTKPVSPLALMQAMDQALQQAASAGKPVLSAGEDGIGKAQPGQASGPIDVDKLLRRLDGDEDTLRLLAQAMRTDLGERLHKLHLALQARDGSHAVAHAHGLMGSLGSMTAERGARLAKGLELAARTNDWTLFERALPLMQAEAKLIDAALGALLSAPLPAG